MVCVGMLLLLKLLLFEALLLEMLPLKALPFSTGLKLSGGLLLSARIPDNAGRVFEAKSPTELAGMLDSIVTHGSSGLFCILRREAGVDCPTPAVMLVPLVPFPVEGSLALMKISGAGRTSVLALEGINSCTASLVRLGTMRRTFTRTFTVLAVSAGLVSDEVIESLSMAATDRDISA